MSATSTSSTVHWAVVRTSVTVVPSWTRKGMAIARQAAMLTRSANANPRANPATMTAVMRAKMNGESQ